MLALEGRPILLGDLLEEQFSQLYVAAPLAVEILHGPQQLGWLFQLGRHFLKVRFILILRNK